MGRRPLNITLTNICEVLRAYRNIKAAAQELNCSEAYIYNILKANGRRLKDIPRDVKTGASPCA